MPRLSVLMPVRNAEGYVLSAVRSTLRAMPRDSELLVMDDASTDRTGLLLGQVDDARLIVRRSSVSLGVANALNDLLLSTDSEFVARMDADDECYPWRFRFQATRMRAVDFSFTAVELIDSLGRPIPGWRSPVPIPYRTMRLSLLLGNPLVHSSMYCRRDRLDSLEGYRQTRAEDYDLWMRACIGGMKLEKSPLVCVKYRMHPGQVTAGPSWHLNAFDEVLMGEYRELLVTEFGQSFAGVMIDARKLGRADAFVNDRVRAEYRQSFTKALAELPALDRLTLQMRLRRRHGL